MFKIKLELIILFLIFFIEVLEILVFPCGELFVFVFVLDNDFLKSIDLSSFNTSNVNDMSCIFYECSSLKKENVKIKNSEKRILNELKNN